MDFGRLDDIGKSQDNFQEEAGRLDDILDDILDDFRKTVKRWLQFGHFLQVMVNAGQ